MNAFRPVWAVIPIKDTKDAKQRLANVMSGSDRIHMALAMIEDVLEVVTQVKELAGVIVVTAEPAVSAIATRLGAVVTSDHAHDSHTGAVMATARRLDSEGWAMLTVPIDIPLVSPDDIRALLAARGADPSFTIVPARDLQGSNAVLVSPAAAVALSFGDNSFYRHLDAARAAGIKPTVVRAPSIELDIDMPEDLALLRRAISTTRACALVERLLQEGTANEGV
jgi:2-phospho-L-lactate/phosphoenolpyruvate guanylyltransferase